MSEEPKKSVNKMNKKIKFALILKDGEEVRIMSELKKFFDIREIIEYFYDGKLERWLLDHHYDSYAKEISDLRKSSNSGDTSIDKIIGRIHKIFEIPFSVKDRITSEEVAYIRQLSEKKRELSQIIDDKDALNNIAAVARNQDELRRIIDNNRKKPISVFLLNNCPNPYVIDTYQDVETTKLRFVGVDTKGKHQGKPTDIKFKFDFTDTDSELIKEVRVKNFIKQYKNRFSYVRILPEIKTENNSEENVFKSLGRYLPKVAAQGFETSKKGEENSVEVVQDKIIRYMDAGFPLIYINTFEEDKVDDIIEEAASERTLFEWNAKEFFGRIKGGQPKKISKEGWSLKVSLRHLIRVQEVDEMNQNSEEKSLNLKYNLKGAVLVLKDAHGYLRDDEVIAHLKHLSHLIYSGQLEDCNIIIVSPILIIPKELENYLTIVRLGNLTESEITNLIKEFCKNHDTNEPDKNFCENLAVALKGLSEFDIINILSLALSGNNQLKRSDIKLILEQKKQMIEKSNVLEMIDVKETLDDIGGLENLKKWLSRKSKIFGDMARAVNFGVQIPKGILIVGMPGCGKSLSAKATAKTFSMPLLKMDMGRIMGKFVGESEANMARAIQLSEAIAPCVLWIDEIEKVFSGIGSGGGSAEVTTRLFGTFLTWMQEKKKAVFVVATANDVSSLPPELLRKGRFDEIFYIGLPNSSERRKIFEIYIRKLRGKDFEKLSPHIDRFVEVTRNYSGADIEGVVREAVELAFIERSENKVSLKKDEGQIDFSGLTEEHLEKAIEETYSISQAQSNVIDDLKSKKFKNASAEDTGDTLYKTLGYHYGRMKRKLFLMWKAIRNKGSEPGKVIEETRFQKFRKKFFKKFSAPEKQTPPAEEKPNEKV